jgi:subtilisin family serine protease
MKKVGFLLTLMLFSLLLAGCTETSTPRPTTPAPNSRPDSKVDSALQTILARYETEGIAAIRDYARNYGMLDDMDRVRFGITLTHATAAQDLQRWLETKGAIVTAVYNDQMSVRITFDNLKKAVQSKDFWQELGELKTVKDVRVLVSPPKQESGFTINDLPFIKKAEISAVTPHSLPSLRNPVLKLTGAEEWKTAGYTGKGVKIGIIDSGFKDYRKYLGTVLPTAEQVTLKSFVYGAVEGQDLHGTAVAEIIVGYAPSANYYFTPIEDEIGFAQAVDWLMEQKVNIIHVSMAWGGLWAGDGTGLMNEKLDKARERGILPVVSAGNYAQSHYLKKFQLSTNNFHAFGEGKNFITLTPNDTASWVALRWNENWQQPKTNLDLVVLDSNLQPIGSGRNRQGNGSSKPPTELVAFATKPKQPVYIQVRVIGELPKEDLTFHLFGYNATLEESMPEGSIATPGDAKGALTIGATNWQDESLEKYSSRGPTTDGRFKPELVAPSRITSQVYGGQIFLGTSAAAPQVSGIAALIWSVSAEFKADAVEKYLRRNAKLPEVTPDDQAWGYGQVRLGTVAETRSSVSEMLGAEPSAPTWRDDFSSISGDLPDNIAAYYGKLPDGSSGYFVQTAEQGIINWHTYQSRYLEEFRAEFSVSAPTKPEAGMVYGLVFWQKSQNDYYLLAIADNNFAVLRRQANQWSEIVGWESSAQLVNRPTRLSLEATKGYLRIRVGTSILKSKTLNNVVPGGKLGFAAGIFGNGVSGNPNELKNNQIGFSRPQVIFSNLIVTPLTS